MSSETDQAVTPQSIEDKIGDALWGSAEEPADQAVAEESAEVDTEDTEDQAVDQSEETQKSPAVEEIEVEVEGWKGKIPAKLKAELDKVADYTKKTQAVADERRLLETQSRVQQEYQTFLQQNQPLFEEVRQMKALAEQYENADVTNLDPDSITRISRAEAQLRAKISRKETELQQAQGQFKQQMISAWDDMGAKAKAAISRSIPNWENVAGDVAQYALREGYPFEHVTGYDRQTRERVGPGVVDPRFATTLYKAMQYDKLQANKATTMAKANKAPPVVKPGAIDNGSQAQSGLLGFRKALKSAGSDSRRAELIGERVASKFFKG